MVTGMVSERTPGSLSATGAGANVAGSTWPIEGAVPPGPLLPKAPTGIRGLDQVLLGGLPRGRTTLVTGGAGSGKTLLAMEFLVRGARDLGEPGVLVTFEESAAKVSANVASLGFDLGAMERAGSLIVHAFRVDPMEIVETGDFDLEPMFLLLADSIDRIGAKRVVLDTVEVLFGAFQDGAIVRAELSRLFRWLEDRQVTAIITGEQGVGGISRHGIEEYVSDCVIALDHRVREEISTRRLRVVKYRGSAHGTNEYPFLITVDGFHVLPITSVALDYDAPEDRVSTGIARLDHMLSGGPHRGSTVLMTGAAGTGKTTLAAQMAHAACARGERALVVLFEESPAQLTRNMRTVGLDLRQWEDAGLLRIWAARPSAYGLETHLAMLARLVEEGAPSLVVLDGIAGLLAGQSVGEVASMLARQFDLLKGRGTTIVATSLAHGDETSTVAISSLVDTWILLRNVETDGERNRLLFVLKSRGTAHSNQVREFRLTDTGIDLVDVYIGADGVLTGSARLAQEARDQQAARDLNELTERRSRELRIAIEEDDARLAALRDAREEKRAELERIARRTATETAEADRSQARLAAQRWADPTRDGGEA